MNIGVVNTDDVDTDGFQKAPVPRARSIEHVRVCHLNKRRAGPFRTELGQ